MILVSISLSQIPFSRRGGVMVGQTVLPADLSIGALGTKFQLTTEISSSLTPPFPSQGQLAV